MVEIIEVKTKKQQREFLDFPLKMYRDNPYFVPPLYMDEKKIFDQDYVYYDQCDAVYYNAYRDGVMVGRISGILQKVSNEIRNEKRVRFARFDAINDLEVAKALFDAVEAWAKSVGMDEVVGPLGFSDLEREGLLIEGFDQMSTFEEQYNADYYGGLIEKCGYGKEVDWVESRLQPNDEEEETLLKTAELVMKRYKLHLGEARNTNDFLNRYKDQFFELLDESYKDIYGTVPFTDAMKKMMIDNFKLIIDMRYVSVVLDEQGKVVCLAIVFPAIGKALQKSGGHLTPAALVKVLKEIRHPHGIDLGLIGVDPEYLNRGVPAILMAHMLKMYRKLNVQWADTNLNLEDNSAIRNMWKHFNAVENKRRRCYVKNISENCNK